MSSEVGNLFSYSLSHNHSWKCGLGYSHINYLTLFNGLRKKIFLKVNFVHVLSDKNHHELDPNLLLHLKEEKISKGEVPEKNSDFPKTIKRKRF